MDKEDNLINEEEDEIVMDENAVLGLSIRKKASQLITYTYTLLVGGSQIR